ncbi:hypothetical protein FHU41_002140 [Psychromicrobium silvestre]|uniref:DinB superfamily n=1 Tax=Psychromicrobium silvestre TaxID=1645614 RepID=A0A7Y9LUK2_9MICC|nr:DinB family protein [Psychromicrobium silvestre]NYE95890.1 hypothetical protein [Psychromicrobium silvestre]
MDPLQEKIIVDYRRAVADLEYFLGQATPAELQNQSAGTKWTNEELLFHMVFGFMVTRTLLPLVRVVTKLPRSWRKGFARLLNAGTIPFDIANYWGSKLARRVYNRHRMATKLIKTTQSLLKQLGAETPVSLTQEMDFPTRWDPFFHTGMTLAELYTYPTLHFDFHARQLTLNTPPAPPHSQSR